MRFARIFIAVLLLSASAIAQTTLNPTKPFNPTLQQLTAPNLETYGTASEAVIAVSDFEFNPISSTTMFAWNNGRYMTSFNEALVAGLHLPEGALLTRVEAQACNTNATESGTLFLVEMSNSSGSGSPLGEVFINANTNCTLFPVTLIPHTVNNALNSYYLDWHNGNVTDGTIKIQAARVYYKLQVSPDPATSTFTDVPVGHPFHRFVEALAAAGITAGCGNGNYCPDAPVTRGQMAVFLSAALGLHWAP